MEILKEIKRIRGLMQLNELSNTEIDSLEKRIMGGYQKGAEAEKLGSKLLGVNTYSRNKEEFEVPFDKLHKNQKMVLTIEVLTPGVLPDYYTKHSFKFLSNYLPIEGIGFKNNWFVGNIENETYNYGIHFLSNGLSNNETYEAYIKTGEDLNVKVTGSSFEGKVPKAKIHVSHIEKK